jgi:hypothetical protein
MKNVSFLVSPVTGYTLSQVERILGRSYRHLTDCGILRQLKTVDDGGEQKYRGLLYDVEDVLAWGVALARYDGLKALQGKAPCFSLIASRHVLNDRNDTTCRKCGSFAIEIEFRGWCRYCGITVGYPVKLGPIKFQTQPTQTSRKKR